MQRRLRPTPVLSSSYLKSFDIDEYLDGLTRPTKEHSRFRQLCQLQAAIETTAKELQVSWDLDTARIVPSLEGYLPDIPFPIFEPEAPVPGAPHLEMFDLDALLTARRHQELCAPLPPLPLPEDMQDIDIDHLIIQRVNEVCAAVQSGSSRLSISDAHDLRQVAQAMQHRRSEMGKRRKEGSEPGSPIKPDRSRIAIHSPQFSLIEATDYLYTPVEVPLSDAEIVEDSLLRRKRVVEARLALDCLKEPQPPVPPSARHCVVPDSPSFVSSCTSHKFSVKNLSSARSSLRSSLTARTSSMFSPSASLAPNNTDVWRAYDSPFSVSPLMFDLPSTRTLPPGTSRSIGDSSNLLSTRRMKPLKTQNLYKQFLISSLHSPSPRTGLSECKTRKQNILNNSGKILRNELKTTTENNLKT